MKFLIALFAILAVVSAEFTVKTMEDLVKMRPHCVKEVNVTAEEIEQFKKWNFTEEGNAPCYLKCMFIHMNLFDDEKGFMVDNLVKQMSNENNKDTIKAEIEKCTKQEGDNKCLHVFSGFNCFRKSNLQLIKMSLKDDKEKKEKKEA